MIFFIQHILSAASRGVVTVLAVAVFCLWAADDVYANHDGPARIAIVLSASITPYQNAMNGFKDEMSLNRIAFESKTFDMSLASGEDMMERIDEYHPDLIHTIGTNATKFIKKNIKTLPVVFSMTLNPVDSGLITTMDSSGNNLTGASMDVPVDKQFAYIKSLIPDDGAVGVIYSQGETGRLVREAEGVARSLGLRLIKKRVNSAMEVPKALYALTPDVDFLWSVADKVVFTNKTIREFLLVTLREKIPFMGLSQAYVKAGALMAFDSADKSNGADAARSVISILKGASPSHIPTSQPDKVTLFFNRSVAKQLGALIPDTYNGDTEIIVLD